ncbi:hypothetical protein BLAT2472_11333 [Burkholderia latens]
MTILVKYKYLTFLVKYPCLRQGIRNALNTVPLSACRAAAQRVQQARARALDLIEHLLKTLRTAEIRIGDFGLGRARRELHQQAQLVAMLGRAAPAQLGEVCFIHRQQQVEPLEIRRAHLSRPQRRQVIAARACSGLRARVGRLADVPVAGARRIDRDPVGQPGRVHLVTHHAFCGGRTADIAETDETDRNAGHRSIGKGRRTATENNTPLYKGVRNRAAAQSDGRVHYSAFGAASTTSPEAAGNGVAASPTSPNDTARASSADA